MSFWRVNCNSDTLEAPFVMLSDYIQLRVSDNVYQIQNITRNAHPSPFCRICLRFPWPNLPHVSGMLSVTGAIMHLPQWPWGRKWRMGINKKKVITTRFQRHLNWIKFHHPAFSPKRLSRCICILCFAFPYWNDICVKGRNIHVPNNWKNDLLKLMLFIAHLIFIV